MAHAPNLQLRRLFQAQLPADFADWLDFVAIGALLAFVWTAPPMAFAFLAVCMGLPYLMIGPLAGAWVDRLDTRTVMVASNLGRGLVTGLFILAPDWPTLLTLIALRSTVDTFFTPAKQSAIQALTTPADRNRANGISHAINQVSKIAAPAIGGALLVLVTPQMIFGLNAGVSLIAAALILRLDPLPKAPSSADVGLIASARAGLSEVRATPILRSAMLMMCAGYFAMFFYDTLIAPMTRDLGFSQTHLGFALAAVGAGGVLGALGIGLLKDASRPFLLIASGAAVSGVIVVGLGLVEATGTAISSTVFIAGFAVAGVATSITLVPFRTLIQNHTSEASIGKITALSEALNTLALLSAPFVGAALAAATTIGAAFILGGTVMCAVAVKAFTLRDLS